MSSLFKKIYGRLTSENFAKFKKAVVETGIKAFFVVHCVTSEEGPRVIQEVRDI